MGDAVRASLNDEVDEDDFSRDPEAKGPDENRLENHAVERKAYAARLRRESE